MAKPTSKSGLKPAFMKAGKQSLVTAAKKGKGLNSSSANLFQMGRKSK